MRHSELREGRTKGHWGYIWHLFTRWSWKHMHPSADFRICESDDCSIRQQPNILSMIYQIYCILPNSVKTAKTMSKTVCNVRWQMTLKQNPFATVYVQHWRVLLLMGWTVVEHVWTIWKYNLLHFKPDCHWLLYWWFWAYCLPPFSFVQYIHIAKWPIFRPPGCVFNSFILQGPLSAGCVVSIGVGA